MAYRQIWLSKNGGTEIDRDGWRELMELCPYIRFNEPVTDIADVITAVGGVYYQSSMYNSLYNSWGTPTGGCTLIDGNNPRFGAYISNFPISDTLGEHYNCMYVNVSDDIDPAHTVIDCTFGLYCSLYGDVKGNFTSDSINAGGFIFNQATADTCVKPNEIIDGGGSFVFSQSFNNIAEIGAFLAPYMTIYTNMPVFLRVEDLQAYIEDGTIHNCLNDVETVEDIGSANKNKYCQTHILTMDANGHNKNEIHNYYYTYKMPNTQNIVGYVLDDSNDLNVRFKAQNDVDEITIENMYTGTTRILTGANFNNFQNAGANEYWYGCSTKREHTLTGGKICWATFGRMNIYIFGSLALANDYLETGDPSRAINYDDIDEIPQRASQKTGEDAGDQKTQNNALVEGWEEPSLSNVYILNATKMKQVAELIFPNVDTAGELPQAMKDLKASLGLYGENPINDIIDVWHCPINPSTMVGRETRNLIFGSYRSNISGTCVTSHGIIKNLGATVISPIYNDFRDYEMEIVLYLPYFGTVDLPCDIYMGKQIDIKATIDLRSHNLRYYIFTNNTLMEYHDCAIGTSYPLMGQDVAGKASQTIKSYNMVKTAQRNATISAGMSVVNGAIGLMTGNPSQFVQSGANIEQTNANIALQKKQFEHDVKYTQPPRSIVGSSSPSCSENDIPYPYIVFKIPQTIKPPLLQSTYGLPSNIVTRIGDVSGYAQIENVQLQSSLPLRIQSDILNKLANGVVIN